MTLDCMEAKAQDGKGVASEICVNTATREIVSDTRKYHGSEVQRAGFSDFAEFEGYRYPRKLELLENGKPLVDATVVELKIAEPLDARMTTPPEGAIERRECDNPKPPALEKPVDPDFGGPPPRGAKARVAFTVLASGQVINVYVIDSGGAKVDRALMDALRDAKFMPALCGTDPVDFDTEMLTDFQ